MNVTRSELERRRDVFQEKLQQGAVDGALLVQQMSMYYFTGTMQCQYVYVPAEGEVLGLVRKNMMRAQAEAGVSLVPLSGFASLPALLGENERLGLELDILPATLYLRLAALFSKSELTDISRPVREVRQVKSPYELELLAEAARMVDAMNRRVPELLVEGKEEIVLASEAEAILRALGHQGVSRMRGFSQEMFYGHVLSGESGGVASFLDSPTGGTGLSAAQPQSAGRKKLAYGEPITIDYAGIYQGYTVDQTRLFSIGPLPDDLNRAFDAALAVQDKVCELLMPGKSGEEIYLAAAAAAAKAGLANHFMGFGDTQVRFVGHGVGLEFDEFPVLAKGSPHLLAENCVVAVEPKFVFPGIGVVGIENTWVVRKEGARKISLTPDEPVSV
ncbi:MAG: Xaa-Pro peptidase family protein [Firmicutes bacterium]|nr:Xaa-Pro peptidase family protein [Bacillota bacterium]